LKIPTFKPRPSFGGVLFVPTPPHESSPVRLAIGTTLIVAHDVEKVLADIDIPTTATAAF